MSSDHYIILDKTEYRLFSFHETIHLMSWQRFFKQTTQFLQQINVKKCPFSIRTRDLSIESRLEGFVIVAKG